MAVTIREMGNQLLLNFEGATILFYPTSGGLWIASSPTGGPDPGDPDPNNPGFKEPFPWSCVSSEYGPRSGRVHQGIDFASVGTGEAFAGADIHAANDGTVQFSGYSSGFGNHIIINHGVIGDRQLYTIYAHMVNPSPFSQGDTVNKWDVVGNVGNTGNSYGAHLHWETHIANVGGGISFANPGTHRNPRDFMVVYGETV